MVPGVSLLALVACADQREDDPTATVTLTQSPEVTSDDPSADSSSSETTAPAPVESSGGEKLDVGGGTGMNSGGDDLLGCKKVDIIFVVDGSGSMADEQGNLLSAFPGFIDTMRTELDGAEGYNIGVIRTDGNDISCEPGRYGVLVTRNFAAGSSDATCTPYASGGRYMTQEDNLTEKFSCAARVGIGGDGDEQPMQALTAALNPPNTDAGDCNDGFLRDDALLVITFVSDDPNREDEGDPQQWYDAVVTAKLGDPGAVVVLGLTPAWPDCEKDPGDLNGAHWAEFVAAWGDHGVHGDVCGTAADYVTFFESAVATIDQACEDYQPPG